MPKHQKGKITFITYAQTPEGLNNLHQVRSNEGYFTLLEFTHFLWGSLTFQSFEFERT
jgi:hypothetical protein